MTYDEIKKEAKKHKGMEFSADTFKYSFEGHGMTTLNRLVKEGVFLIGKPYPNAGRPKNRYIVA